MMASAPPPPPAYGTVASDQQPAPYSDPPPKYEPPSAEQQQQGFYPGPPPPPGQMYPPQVAPPQGYQGATVYPGLTTTHHTVVMCQPGYGPMPKSMECPNCHAAVTTSLHYQTGGLTWLAAGLLCLIGCWMGCCLIPFCVDDLQDVQHRCPNCGHCVGTFTRL